MWKESREAPLLMWGQPSSAVLPGKAQQLLGESEIPLPEKQCARTFEISRLLGTRSSLLTLRPRPLKLIALLPPNQLGQTRASQPQRKSKPRRRRVPHQIHLRMALMAAMVITLF